MDDKYQTALLLSAARVDSLAKALERSWGVQLLLAAIGVALILDLGSFRETLAGYFGQEDANMEVAAGVLLTLTLYFFIRFGHFLSSFLRARRLHEDIVEEFRLTAEFKHDFRPLTESLSYFEGYFTSSLFGEQKQVTYMYYILTACALSVGQAASLYLILLAYGTNYWTVPLLIFLASGLLLLWFGFYRAKKEDHPQTRWFVPLCTILILFWFGLFNMAQ